MKQYYVFVVYDGTLRAFIIFISENIFNGHDLTICPTEKYSVHTK